MKQLFRIVLFFILSISMSIYANDLSEFANLGFSEDSQYFMFSQYGHKADDIFAEIIVVDISKNNYVPNGYFYKEFDGPFPIGQHGFGALLTILNENTDLNDRYDINHVKTGRIIYISLVENQDSLVRFRDFISDTMYTVVLNQNTQRNASSAISSSFSLELTAMHPTEGRRFFMVGAPDRYRDNIEKYSLQQIILSPDERSLVFLIAMHERKDDGISIRYMVETLVVR